MTLVYVPDTEASERMKVSEALARRTGFTLRCGESLTASPEEITREIGDAVVVCVALGHVSAAAMDTATDLRLIVKCGIGVDNIDVEAARERNIPVIRMGRVNSRGPAEWVIATALSLFRRLPEMDAAVRSQQWVSTRAAWTGRLPALTGRTIGIAGFGAIGRYLARLAIAHEMDVIATDPFVDAAEMTGLGVTLVDKDTLLSRADVLSLNMVLTAETRHYIGRRELELMKSTAILCNASRGPVVDQIALASALNDGLISAAALDVFEHEPLEATSPLLNAPNLILTPHLGGCTDHGYTEIGELAAELIERFVSGLPIPEYCVAVAGGRLIVQP